MEFKIKTSITATEAAALELAISDVDPAALAALDSRHKNRQAARMGRSRMGGYQRIRGIAAAADICGTCGSGLRPAMPSLKPAT